MTIKERKDLIKIARDEVGLSFTAIAILVKRSKTRVREIYFGNYSSSLRKAKEAGAKGTHTHYEWEALKRDWNYMCLCCKRKEPNIKLTKDHIIPLSLGGDNSIDNIQPLCGSCNSRKMQKDIDFRKKEIGTNPSFIGVKNTGLTHSHVSI